MYDVMLVLHSWLRWAVFLGGIVVIITAVQGLKAAGAPRPEDVKKVRINAVIFDIQAAVGLLLYGVLSPLTQAAFSNMGAAMKDANLRFWAVEHIFLMLVAWGCTRVGAIRFRKAKDAKGYKTLLILSVVGFLSMVAVIPWPMRAIGRVLFRF